MSDPRVAAPAASSPVITATIASTNPPWQVAFTSNPAGGQRAS